jgi:hypothetical protein
MCFVIEAVIYLGRARVHIAIYITVVALLMVAKDNPKPGAKQKGKSVVLPTSAPACPDLQVKTRLLVCIHNNTTIREAVCSPFFFEYRLKVRVTIGRITWPAS